MLLVCNSRVCAIAACVLSILQVRGLMFTDNANDKNENFETPLMIAAANGASEDDICLLIKVTKMHFVLRNL